jgi:hypothetical protein
VAALNILFVLNMQSGVLLLAECSAGFPAQCEVLRYDKRGFPAIILLPFALAPKW